MAARNATWEKLHAFAASLPGAYDDMPWGDHCVKVGKKIFIFMGDPDATQPHITVKLVAGHAAAMSVPGAVPTGHGLGKAGWVTLPIRRGTPPAAIALAWIEESYRLIKPKKLIAQLDLSS
jgi:predicted DNA-binding protein (MmcQ/YjbR family)